MKEISLINCVLRPIGIFNNNKENNNIIGIKNSDNNYNVKKKENEFSLNNANNYVYLGSTNMPLLNNMGITLSDDGSLMLIKGKTHDLFTGLYQKHIKNGFKYNVFNIESQTGDDIKFKELYVDSQGNLIGNKRDKSGGDNENNTELYKIKFNKIEKNYDLNGHSLNENGGDFIIEYEKYIVADSVRHDLSSINNIVEKTENNILKVNRKGLNITIEVKDNQLLAMGLPATIKSEADEPDNKVDSESLGKYKIKLPLKETDKILAIKPVLNQIQLVVDKGNRIKIYYLDPLNIFSIKDYQYEVTRLKQEPPLSFYSMIGENNYKNYHSGQPFSTQTIGNFSSRHIPFISSYIDNARIHIDKAKQEYALKKYKEMTKNIAKSIDPGFRGLFSSIKGLTNSSISPSENKYIALHRENENINKSYEIINRVIKGIDNGIKQGEIIYSLVKELKKNESITVNNENSIRAFFGINAFSLSDNIGVNAFLLANYAKNKSLTLSKNEKDQVTFSFVNKVNANVSGGLSAGITSYNKQWNENAINYGFITPVMASVLFNLNYEKKSNFSFSIELNEVANFINGNLSLSQSEIINKSKLENNKSIELSLVAELRSEISLNIETNTNNDRYVAVPRNAIGGNIALNLMKLGLNINKIISYGEEEPKEAKRKLNFDFLILNLTGYRDLRVTPSTASSTTSPTSHVQWYPLAAVNSFEMMLQKKINSLFKVPIYDSEYYKNKTEFEEKRKDLKGIYKRILKLNKLLDKYPKEYNTSSRIGKLDDIYLSLSADKKQSNKLKDKPIYSTSRNAKVKQFLADLKEKKETLASQEKDSMNEKFKPYFISKYQLEEKSEKIYDEIEKGIKTLLDEVKEKDKLTLKDIKVRLDNLYDSSKKDLIKIKYIINSIDVMSVSELAYKGKSLPLVLLSLESKKSISHHQVKGEIKFDYEQEENGDKTLSKINTNYYF